jgi:hypothetical protein
MRQWGAALAVVFATAACGGGGDRGAASPPLAVAPVTTSSTLVVPTTSTSAVTTTTTVPPYSFDGSVPPPPLVNTGRDFDAVYRSLDAYTHWLYAHMPDPDLVVEVAATGTRLSATYGDEVSQLRTSGIRMYDVNSRIRSIEVVDEHEDLVALRVSYDRDRRVLIDSTGWVVDDEALPPVVADALLAADSDDRWRLAALNAVSNPAVEIAP